MGVELVRNELIISCIFRNAFSPIPSVECPAIASSTYGLEREIHQDMT
jgi:hypothetical protein